ncbi:MAG TPA: methyltransferase [Sandaracinaceae bacterium]
MGDALYRLRTWSLTFAQRMLARSGPIEHGGLSLYVAPGVHDPAPAFGIGFAPLQRAALDRIPPGASVLELGTGAGFWALCAALRGLVVTATDLPHVPLEPVAEAAARAGVTIELRHSDLFDELAGARFDAILFNPPFHDAAPRTLRERAWCGGEVVRRCLHSAPDHLSPGGALYLIVPRLDRRRYTEALSRWSVEVAAARWYPLLGRTELLVLRPR